MSKLKDKPKEIVNDENRDLNKDAPEAIAYRKNTEEENQPLKSKKKKNKNQKAKEIVPIDINFTNSKNGGKKEFKISPKKSSNVGTHQLTDAFDSTSCKKRSERFAKDSFTEANILEKEYLRNPDINLVRGEKILLEALKMVKKRYFEDRDYRYASDQLKTIRQDLIIQNIRTETTAKTYILHCKIALEEKDIAEFNLCLSMLYELYQSFKKSDPKFKKQRKEFLAYKIIYLIYAQDTIELSLVLSKLTPTEFRSPCVAHAVQVSSAYNTQNYNKLLRLYKEAPNMGSLVMDLFVNSVRKQALKSMAYTYKEEFPLSFFQEQLAFPDPYSCKHFLGELGVNVNNKISAIDVKQFRTIEVK